MKLKNKAKTTLVSSAKTSKVSDVASHANKQLLIDADNVSVQFAGRPTLDDVSLCMHAGEFIGLIGPNGAGKTTLLRVMLGLMQPDSGRIRRDKAATFEYVPQRGHLYNGIVPLSVLEIVRLGSRGNENRALEALAQAGIEDLARVRFNEVSGGQQQRVAIAKALAAEADVLILDEPTTGIDEQSQHEFFGILQALQQKGITVVMVSHEVDVVLTLVTRVICLNQTILYDGTPEHFEGDKYLPKVYTAHHRQLHHHHEEAANV